MKQLNLWWWLGYPVLVVILIGFSYNLLFAGGEFSKLTSNSSEVANEAARVAVIAQKVTALEAVNLNTLDEQSKKLALAVPATKPVWQMVQNINVAASSSGSIVDGYKSSVGSLKVATDSAGLEDGLAMDVEYTVTDFSALIKLLESFESRLPLTRVVKFDMSAGKVVMSINSLWKPWMSVSQMAASPLPEGFRERIKMGVDKLANYADVNSEVATLGGETADRGIVNPF